MGDMADLTLEQIDWEDEDCFHSHERRELRCRSCNKDGLSWRKFKNRWVLFEPTGEVHICHGYEPPLDILKGIAKETLTQSKLNFKEKIKDKLIKHGSLGRMVNVLTDAELLSLYQYFIIENEAQKDPELSWGRQNYGPQIKYLQDEILRRMNKNV
jgi:hypothetical protein